MKYRWPFDDPENVATITTKDIIERTKQIKYVSHDDEDGMWQFHSGELVKEEDGRIVSLQEIIIIDPTVMELVHLPLGWIAIRDNINDKWKRINKQKTYE
ncbi:hypothetical protein QPK24_10880 [Paenibacillus polygoni]|uniref:DUF2185 domain-containing protein n=1 Tax=Paenibacillus polygoni TaxID=3050112 RepID=A0ABY8X9K0_9BACL|nr:hypothetical protein [Paenibacillus polygoni]WIV21132.1 hypothetical protein QPK24_10880 [Paenibacillus polygoni]